MVRARVAELAVLDGLLNAGIRCAAQLDEKVPVAPNEEDEGRSDNERLVEGGVAEAEIEQSFQATRTAAKEDLRIHR